MPPWVQGGHEAGGEGDGNQASGIFSKPRGPTEYQDTEPSRIFHCLFTKMFAKHSKQLTACDRSKEEADNIMNSLHMLIDI